MPEQTVLLPLIALLPLLAALAGLLLRRLPPVLHAGLGIAALAGSAACALAVNAGFSAEVQRAGWSIPWINGIEMPMRVIPSIPLALRADYTQLLFVLTTCLIGIAVLLYAIRERRGDPQAAQFHALLTFFCGSMLLFLVSDTLILLYIAWELMGLAGYLLIRHRGTPEANRAARQAFWTTRATDFGLLFAIFIFMFGFSRYGVNMVLLSQVNISQLIGHVNTNVMQAVSQGSMTQEAGIALLQPEFSYIVSWMGAAAVLVLLAVVGKAALLPLSFWLPDAMVAPAPVSALLHSATLVAAGPLLASQILFGRTIMSVDAYGQVHLNDLALACAVAIGGLTLLIGAACACFQRQPKRLLAWSTVSQLGLCILGSGVLAVEAARFQLLSHAWFKAALFLGVGILAAVWHERRAAAAGNLHGDVEPELHDLAGSARAHPLLYWLGLAPAALSLAGFVGLAGFYGKEQILNALLHRSSQQLDDRLLSAAMPGMPPYWQAGAWMLLISMPFTAAYCGRLLAGLNRRVASDGTEAEPAAAPGGWGLPTAVTVVLALVGSLGLSAFWFSFRTYFEGRHNQLAWAADFEPLTAGIALALVLAGGFAGIRGAQGNLLRAGSGFLEGLSAFLREGLYLKQIFTGIIGGFGEFLAILAGIADIRLVDWLAMRFGAFGRWLAKASAWLDIHFVDGIRWWCCEIWWITKRVHGRYWQNGQIQNYMLVLLLGAVLLCLVIAFPLNEALGRILGRYN